jgi:hypothetical protein
MASKRIALTLPLFVVLAALFAACVDATPESATNLVGGSHEITANADDAGICDEIEEDFEIECLGWIGFFAVVAGPGAGETNLPCDAEAGNEELANCISDVFFECLLFGESPADCGIDDSGCDPSDCVSQLDDPVSWTYQNAGESGTDYIVVCMLPMLEEPIPAIQELFEARGQQTAQLTDEEIEDLIEFWETQMGCDLVTKTWIDPTPTPSLTPEPELVRRSGVNIGPVLAAADAERRARQESQQQVAGVQQQAGGPIRPPNTGDGGLR